MEAITTANKFQHAGRLIIQKSGKLLVLVGYQNQSEDFFLLLSENDLLTFVQTRKPKDHITVFRHIEEVEKGVINQVFIDHLLAKLEKPKYTDWLTIFPKEPYMNGEWYYDETKDELEESLHMHIDNYVFVLEDPKWLNDSSSFLW